MAKTGFDRKYYDRFYETKQTRVHGAAEIARLCTAVTAFLEWWNYPVTTVLDVGAGTGLWRDWFQDHRPKVKYRSTEYSDSARDLPMMERVGTAVADNPDRELRELARHRGWRIVEVGRKRH